MTTERTGDFRGAGDALWNRRQELQATRDRLEALAASVCRPIDMSLPEYGQLFAAALDFQPDLVVEIGRGWGNSTCALTEAANHLRKAKVLSFCLSDIWQA